MAKVQVFTMRLWVEKWKKYSMIAFFWSRKRLLFFIVVALSALVFVVSDQLAQKYIPEPGVSIGAPFSLVDHHGGLITEKVFQGGPSLLFFGFTYCPEVCPTTLIDLIRLTEELDLQVPIYFVTLDPERDTPEQLADYLPYFGKRIIGITGESDAVLSLAKSWGIYRKKIPTSSNDYTIDHTATVFMLSDTGKFAGTIAWQEAREVVKQKLLKLSRK